MRTAATSGRRSWERISPRVTSSARFSIQAFSQEYRTPATTMAPTAPRNPNRAVPATKTGRWTTA